ncbi:M16 family metallopeptidase [Hellea balneolensis]|uniref:M16 family metallopeptidase n=1 Tax=Hellea balneolensis TaxID=287478 RepID=UPI00041DC689|nr:M16 family metallopeptidase [Hellea balneolensis]
MSAATAILLISCGEAPGETYFEHERSDLTAEAKIEYGRLQNGLRYAVMANETPSNTASLLMRFDTGSINEPDGQEGLAHFLEHMAFNGSKNIAEGEMIKRLEKYGLAFGADTNASTSFDETIYQLELPEVNDDILNETLMIMRETASNLTLDPDAIDRERGVILAEKRARISPAYKASIASLKFYLDGSPYPNRIPIGTEEAIRSVTPENFREFYQGYYRPEDTFIVLVGDFETDYASEKIEEFFGDWASVGESKSDVDIKPLGERGIEAEYYVDPEIQTSISLTVMGPPDLRKDTAENRKAAFIESLGNRILSRRLAKIARSDEAAFINASASSSSIYDVRGLSSLSMSTQAETWDKALAQGEQALRQAYEFGFSQDELSEQIANTRKALEVAVQTSPTRRTSSLARQIMSSFSSNQVLTDAKANLERFEAYADTITPEQVHQAFKAKWEGLDTAQLYLSTNRVIEDAENVMLKALEDSRAVKVQPLAETKKTEFAYTEFGVPGKVVSRKTVEDIEFEQIIFENNVRLNIKKTPYQKDVISISVALGKGELFFPEEYPGFKWFAPNMLSLAGLKAHSADDIQTLMAGKTVGASINFGSRRMYMSGATVPDNISDQLNLMAAYATAPGYRAEVKSRYDNYIQSFYPTLDSTPGGVAARDVERLLRSGDRRFGIPDEDELIEIEMSELQKWLDPKLTSEAVEIGVVGDVDVEAVIDQVARTFGALPKFKADIPSLESVDTELKFAKGSPRPIKLSHAGEAETALLRSYWPAPDGTNITTSRRVSMISEMFQLRLTEVMREEEGASYSPSAFSYNPRIYPGFGYIGASLELNPNDIDRISAKVDEIAAEFRAGDFDAALFERAIKPARERIETSLESNGYWMNIISESQSDPESLERHRSRFEAYQNMTVDDLKPLAKTLFDPKQAYRIQVLPER